MADRPTMSMCLGGRRPVLAIFGHRQVEDRLREPKVSLDALEDVALQGAQFLFS